jgi:putative transposase
MAGIDVSVSKELLPGLLGSQDGLAKLVEAVLNQILEAQVTEALGAERHERSEERPGYRNGHRARTLYTRVGPVTLLVPQTRDGSFSTDIFKRYQRSEQAFVLALMEMVVQGVSTRKVSAITEELCGASFSKSTVSSLCAGLDVRVRAFNERRVPVRAGRCPVHPKPAGRPRPDAYRADCQRGEERRLPRNPRCEDRRQRELRHLGRNLPLA